MLAKGVEPSIPYGRRILSAKCIPNSITPAFNEELVTFESIYPCFQYNFLNKMDSLNHIVFVFYYYRISIAVLLSTKTLCRTMRILQCDQHILLNDGVDVLQALQPPSCPDCCSVGFHLCDGLAPPDATCVQDFVPSGIWGRRLLALCL